MELGEYGHHAQSPDQRKRQAPGTGLGFLGQNAAYINYAASSNGGDDSRARMLDGETYIDDNEHEKFMQDDEYLNQDQLLDQLVRDIHDDDEKLPPRVIRSRMAQRPPAIANPKHQTDAISTSKATTSLPPKSIAFNTIDHHQIPNTSNQDDNFSFNFDNLDQDLKHSKAKRLHLDDAVMSQIKNLKTEHEHLKNINK